MESRIARLEAQIASMAVKLAALSVSTALPRKTPVLLLFDLETTGLGKTKFIKICELGAINYNTGAVFQHYVNPGVVVPDRATAVHHLSNEMLQQHPGWAQVQPKWEEWLNKQRPSDDVPLLLGGFNSKRYDSRILTFESNYQYPPNVFFVDFREVFPLAFPDMEGKKSLGGYHQWALSKEITSAHTAVADATAIADICRVVDQLPLFQWIANKQESANGVIKRCTK